MARQVSERRASIDIGTNSVRLLVGDVHPDGRVCALVRRGIVTRLGEGLEATGLIAPGPAERTLKAIREVVSEAGSTGASRIVMAATSALRSATNGPELARRIEQETGLSLRILSGLDEARLVYRSLQHGRTGTDRVIAMDVGGGSTEFAAGYGSEPKALLSLDIGCVRLYERAASRGGVESDSGYEFARGILEEALGGAASSWKAEFTGSPIRGVGGTLTAFAMVHLGTRHYDPDELDGTRMSREDVQRVSARIRSMDPVERRHWVGDGRADLVAAGAAILDEAVRFFEAPEVQVSTRGLRYGLLHEFPAAPGVA